MLLLFVKKKTIDIKYYIILYIKNKESNFYKKKYEYAKPVELR